MSTSKLPPCPDWTKRGTKSKGELSIEVLPKTSWTRPKKHSSMAKYINRTQDGRGSQVWVLPFCSAGPIPIGIMAFGADTWQEGDFKHPNPALRRSITIALIFAFFLSTVAVGLRLLARRVSGNRLYLDDYLIIIALVRCISCGQTTSGYWWIIRQLFKYGCSIGVAIRGFQELLGEIRASNWPFILQLCATALDRI